MKYTLPLIPLLLSIIVYNSQVIKQKDLTLHVYRSCLEITYNVDGCEDFIDQYQLFIIGEADQPTPVDSI